MKPLLLLPLALAAAQSVTPLKFRVEASSESYGSRGTCVGFRVPDNNLVTGSFKINNPHRQQVRAAVLIHEGGNQPFSQQDLNGEARFSFRSRPEGAAGASGAPMGNTAYYEACVRAIPRGGGSTPPGLFVDVALVFTWKFDTFDDEAARKNVQDPIQADLYELESKIARLSGELNDFVRHEELHRDVNEATFSRLRLVSVLAVLALVGLGVYQLFYLKRFFRAKKLI
jgi:hypothetical protein